MRNFAVSIITNIFLSISISLSAQQITAKVDFRPAGADVAQPYFQKGLILLYAFDYKEAIEQFKTAQLLDPNFVMAVWGEAMCYNRPICQVHDYEKGKGALLKLGIFEEDRINLAQNELEKGFLSAVEALYREDELKEKRLQDYFTLMKSLYEKYPEENEVKAFYALAILDRAFKRDDEELFDQATDICENILSKNTSHPGALLYLILANDTPPRAKKAFEAANKMEKLVPSSPFTLHIPSHVYLSQGKWDDVVKANELSWKAADEVVVKNRLSLDDRDYHSFRWLQYGCLQQGRYEKAENMVKDMYQDARMSQSARTRNHFLWMQSAYLINSENWNSPVARLEVPTNKLNITTKMAVLLTEGVKAYQNNDLSRLSWVSERMTDQLTIERNNGEAVSDNHFAICCNETVSRSANEVDLLLAEAMELEINALSALKDGEKDQAIEWLEKACALEAGTPFRSGPPVMVKSSFELYGEILLELGQPQKAAEFFDKSLERYPNRTLSLLGKYKALKYGGDNARASKVKNQILLIWKLADQAAKNKLN